MNKQIVTFILCCFFFGSTNAQYGTDFTWLNFDGTEMETLLDSIEDRFGEFFNDEIFTEEVDRERIEGFLNQLLNHKPINEDNCDPGTVYFINENYTTSGHPDENKAVFFFDNPDILDEYFGSALNLRNNLEHSVIEYNRPGVVFQPVPNPAYILFALNSRCHQDQSPFDIIIVEKDVTFSGLFPPETLGIINAVPLSDEDESPEIAPTSNFLKAFPTPAKEQLRIQWSSKEDYSTSIFIVNGTSGKLVKTIVDNQPLEAGQYQYRVPLDQMSAGIYYVVLQTEEKREMKKVIIVK